MLALYNNTVLCVTEQEFFVLRRIYFTTVAIQWTSIILSLLASLTDVAATVNLIVAQFGTVSTGLVI